MGQLIKFPNIDDRSWREMEVAMKDKLQNEGVSIAAINWICSDLKPRYLSCQNTLSLQVNVPHECSDQVAKSFEEIKLFIHSTTTRMLIEMIRLEAELYTEKFKESDLV